MPADKESFEFVIRHRKNNERRDCSLTLSREEAKAVFEVLARSGLGTRAELLASALDADW
jgi:hypothetical protein